MNFNSVLLLEHTALVRISTILWNQDDIQKLISRYCKPTATFPKPCCMNEIEDKVTKKVELLFLPKPLAEKVLSTIKPISLQIMKWIRYHCTILNEHFVRKYLNRLCWTSEGRIAQKKMAKTMIKDEDFDIRSRFKLACAYCLKDDIQELWDQMPECQKQSYNGDQISESRGMTLDDLWAHDVKGKLTELARIMRERTNCRRSLYQYTFDQAALSGNREATEYLLQKLTPEESDESLMEYAIRLRMKHRARDLVFSDISKEFDDEVLFFLFSQIDRTSEGVFKFCPFAILKLFLYWPLQDMFMETAKLMGDILPERYYGCLLLHIIYKISHGYTDYNYQKLFRTFWRNSPDRHKRYAKARITNGGLSLDLRMNEDIENMKQYFKDSTIQEKEDCVCRIITGQEISICISNRFDSLVWFIRECIPSTCALTRFATLTENRIARDMPVDAFRKKLVLWENAFELLDEIAYGNENREEQNSLKEAKRSCTEFNEETRKRMKI